MVYNSYSIVCMSSMASTFFHSLPSMQDTGNVPLCRAAERGHTGTVETLIEGGANVNHQKKVGGVLHPAYHESLQQCPGPV